MEALPGEEHQRLLLVLLTPIGDTLFATPTIRALRRAYPRAHIAALVFPTNRAVLENNPDVDQLIVHPTREAWPGLTSFLGQYAARRSERYDLLVSFAPYHDYYGLLANITRHLRLPCPWLFWLLPHNNQRWQNLHATEHYLEILRPLGLLRGPKQQAFDSKGWPASGATLPRLSLKVSGRQEAFAERFLDRHGWRPEELLVGVHPGGSGFRGMKRWAPSGFAAVARGLARRRPIRLIFFGNEAERILAERTIVAAGSPESAINACGRTTLSETIGLLSRLDLFLGNDSGPLHLSAAMDVPSVGIFGPTNVRTYRPLGRHAIAVEGNVPCPARFGFVGTTPLWRKRECRGECLESVDPDAVVDAAELLLADKIRGRWGARTLDLSDVNAAL